MKSNNLKPSCSVRTIWGALGILLAIFPGLSRGVDQLFAHEFADGHVERSLSFVVQDRKVFVEYGVGCNTSTMTVLLNHWQANGNATTEPVSQTSSAETGTIQSSTTPESATAKMAAENSAVTEYDSKLSASGGVSTKEIDPANQSSSKPRPMTEQERKIETAFQTAVLAEIARQLEVTCNGERVTVRPVSVELSPRHHVNALAKLEFDLPRANKIRLIAHDVLFSDNGGAVKYALKPKQSTILLRSNVAPILVRAELVDLNELSPEIRAQKTTVDCELSFLPSKTDKGQ